MESQQLELDLSGSLSLVIELTGNPWTDFGIVSFCQELTNAYFPNTLELTPHHAHITIDATDMDRITEWLNQRLRERWNRLYWFSRGAKILGRTGLSALTYDNDDFVDYDKSVIQITEDESAEIKEKWKGSTLKDKLTLTQVRFNFIGIRNNAETFKKGQADNIRDFIQDWTGAAGKKVCEVSGYPTAKPKKLLQVVNPFASKHHNTKVRGVFNNSANPNVGGVYYLINMYATFDENIPFVYEPGSQRVCLILPEIPNLEILSRVYSRLHENLRDDLRGSELYPYTNLRGRIQVSNRYALVLSLFHNIFYEFRGLQPVADDILGDEWNFSSTLADPDKLTRWIIIPFTKGQNVIFQNFHTVDVDARLYDFIKPIPFEQNEIQLVPNILARMRPKMKSPDGDNALGQLSQAIATSTPSLMKLALFNLWKHTDAVLISPQPDAPHPVRQLRIFINHFLEVNQMLDEKLRDDLRAFGTTIGRTFCKDVTLISKLFNISSVNAFREALNTVMFRFYKKFNTSSELKEAIPIKEERVDNILTSLTEVNCKEIAETLSIYVSLSAYNTKIFGAKSNTQGGQND